MGYLRDIRALPGMDPQELSRLEVVRSHFEFRVTEYYAKLVNWSDPDDPLRRMILPDTAELDSELTFDPSDEAANTRIRGLQHKYPTTALLLLTDVCAAYCRFCFRKRFTLATDAEHHITIGDDGTGPARETNLNIAAAMRYLSAHPEIDTVLLTGGDPLMLSAERLDVVLRSLRRLDRSLTIRIGTKMLAFDPAAITGDLVKIIAGRADVRRRTYIVAHFTHSRELTDESLAAIDRLLTAGLAVVNQTPLLRRVNDDADELTALFGQLSRAGVAPYYVFQCRPTHGNESYQVSLQDGLRILDQARERLSGLAKRFRFVASHARGKIEILGMHRGQLHFRFHQARNPADAGRLLVCPADQPVYWVDAALAS